MLPLLLKERFLICFFFFFFTYICTAQAKQGGYCLFMVQNVFLWGIHLERPGV